MNILFLFCGMLLLCSCNTGNNFKKRLASLDSILVSCPDSVFNILADMHDEAMAQSLSDQMYYQLLLADAQNKAYIDFTTDSVMQRVADYYDSYGTANEKMSAHYLLGCAYRDLKDIPMELQCFQRAVESADTTDVDCNWGRLASIYGQMANIYHFQYLPEEELNALSKCEQIAHRNNDRYVEIKSYELRKRAYFLMNMPDSVLSVTMNSRNAYLKMGLRQEAAELLGPAIGVLVDKERYAEAERLMAIYEKESGYFDDPANVAPNHILFFYRKGCVALHHNNIDSAKVYFIKLLECEKEASYKGLLTLYEKVGNPDSISKYARLYAAANDSSFLGNNARIVEQMTAVYNYVHQSRIAESQKKEAKAANKKLHLHLCLSVSAILLVIYVALRIKRSRDREIVNMTNSYFDILMQKENLEKDIQELKSSHKSIVEQTKKNIVNKEKELNALQHLVDYYSGKLELDYFGKRFEAFKQTSIFIRIKQSVRFKDIAQKLTDMEWKRCDRLFGQYFPKYYKFITTGNLLNHDEQRVCMLIILGFSPKEVAAILNKTMPRISNIRASINKKLFNVDSATSLNENLRRLL